MDLKASKLGKGRSGTSQAGGPLTADGDVGHGPEEDVESRAAEPRGGDRVVGPGRAGARGALN